MVGRYPAFNPAGVLGPPGPLLSKDFLLQLAAPSATPALEE